MNKSRDKSQAGGEVTTQMTTRQEAVRLILLKHGLSCSAILLWRLVAFSQRRPRACRTFPLRDTAGLIASKVKPEAVNYQGRKSVRITIEGEDREGLALLPEPTSRMA